ncbi:hypothetical protein B9T16_23055 [Arthrospira sp. PCC 8006]
MCWETRKHGLELELGKVTSLSTITVCGKFGSLVGVESEVAFTPSHTKPCLRLSPHTAPSLIVPLLRIQLWRYRVPFYHRGCGGVIVVSF